MNKKNILFILLLSLSSALLADEGMWMLTDIKEQNAATMRELGLDLDIDEVYSPDHISLKDAVVHFGRGCTGEVISPEGLVLTNHHCGYSYIQEHSSLEHDYLTDGFWAMSPNEELPCKGLTITFIDRILDITSYVKDQLSIDEDPEGTNYLSPSYLEKVATRFAGENDIETSASMILELKPFYGGNRYYLFVKIVYKDIRMVGAPPSSIGKFGSDTDNWTWPRHTGDFSLFRIYADSEGNPTEYSKENIPLKVKKHLSISLNGINEDDFTFVMGFPGRNFRYMISDEVEERMVTTNFMREKVRGIRQAIMMEQMEKDPAIRIQYASKYASSANYWKNAIGMNNGLIRLNVLDTKRKQQEKLLAYGKETGNDSYQNAFEQIRSIVAERRNTLFHQEAIYEALHLGTEFARIPNTDKLLNALRANATSNDSLQVLLNDMKEKGEAFFNKSYNPEVDRIISKAMLKVYCELIPAEERIEIFKAIDQRYKGNIDSFIDDCFDNSIFSSMDKLNKFLQKPSLKVLEKDPMVQYSYSVRRGYADTKLAMQEETNSYNLAHRTWVEGMMEQKRMENIPLYPDANSTLRLTYGRILPYYPANGVKYSYYTTLKGVMEKEDPDNYEFVVPARLKELYLQKDFGEYALPTGEMPVCFITNTDNTGGNSGSPVFNGKGELIGCGFDRNWEGLTGDIAFEPVLQRAICVDIRYVLFIIDKFAGATHLIDEMSISR